jgi:hypothetical protein
MKLFLFWVPLDFSKADEMRTQIPITKQRREDIYKLQLLKS